MALTTFIPKLIPPFTKPQEVSYITNGISMDVNNVKFPLQAGVPIQPIYMFKVIPAPSSANVTSPYTTSTNSAGFTLNPITTQQSATVSSAPFIQVQPITFLGKSGALLDCERSLVVNFTTPSTATTIMTLKGYDYRGVAVQTTTPALTIGTTNYVISTPISIFTSISFSSNPFFVSAATITVQTTDEIGFPYLLTSQSYVISANWNGTSLLPSSGFFSPGYLWRTLGAFTVNTSARGFWELPSSPDGIKEFIMTAYYYGADSEINAEINNLNQSSLKVVGVTKTDSSSYPTPTYVYPYLVSQDLTGVQIDEGAQLTADGYAGDSAFLYAYNVLIAS